MCAEADAFYARLRAGAVPPRWTHMMGDLQWPYNDWLTAAAADTAPLSPWRASMYASTGSSKRSYPEDYRDRWEDAESLAAAEVELRELEGQVVAAAAAGAGRG